MVQGETVVEGEKEILMEVSRLETLEKERFEKGVGKEQFHEKISPRRLIWADTFKKYNIFLKFPFSMFPKVREMIYGKYKDN